MQSSLSRQVLLFAISLILLVLLFSIPSYKDWLKYKIRIYYSEFFYQKDRLDLDTRYKYRFGNNYRLSQNLKNYFDQNPYEDPVLFLPPKAYLARNREKYDWGECLSFYYFTGIRSVDLKSDNINEASHAVVASEQGLKVIEINNPVVRERLIEEYSKYQE